MLAGGAALAAADQAGDVQLEAGLNEGEEAGTQAHLDVLAEHFGEHRLHEVDQVGDGDVLVHHHAFHLEEGVLVAGVGGLVAEAAAGEHSLDRHAVVHQIIAVLAVDGVLGGGSLRLEQLAVVQVVGILHVAGGVELGDVQGLEALVVRDDLGIVLQVEAHGAEHLLTLALHQGDGVIGAAIHIRRHRNVELRQGINFRLQLGGLHGLQLFRQCDGDLILQLVGFGADGLALLHGHVAHALEQLGHLALLAQVAHAQGFQGGHVSHLGELGFEACLQGCDLLVHFIASLLDVQKNSIPCKHETEDQTDSAVPLKLPYIVQPLDALTRRTSLTETHGVKFGHSASLRPFSLRTLSVRDGRKPTGARSSSLICNTRLF